MVEDKKTGTELDIKVGTGGVEAKIRSRWLSALDALLGNRAEIKGLNEALKLQVERNRAERDAFAHERHMTVERGKLSQEMKALEATGDLLVQRLRDDPALVEEFARRYYPELAQKQENVDRSLESASNQLKLLPAPEPSAVEDYSDTVDEDWLNFWRDYAEKASSQRMQRLWGRILAGEIQEEGSFSRTTLRIAAELNKHTATIFQKHARLRYFDGLIVSPTDQSDLDEFIQLEDAGLINGVGANLSKNPKIDDDAGFFVFRSGDWCLHCYASRPDTNWIEVEVFTLTRAGLEFAAIAGQDDKATLLRLAEILGGQFSDITLFPIEHERVVPPGEMLKETEPSPGG
ncbi:DUF2806 domain-containing protein [Mesorhizobium helmanticense]|uniref:DUF2806 domain-containing protein n=1 Tax=Mesorhizobium helmanticense TaxID=1776423 RepID=A0A2T4J201_9HYPH|nr:DUF2806 domain-containing protein [Mesorhizobium helmanticense]PTE11935.1 hypothetical protein C9427_02495 [Mesorhizobium helmanticense]